MLPCWFASILIPTVPKALALAVLLLPVALDTSARHPAARLERRLLGGRACACASRPPTPRPVPAPHQATARSWTNHASSHSSRHGSILSFRASRTGLLRIAPCCVLHQAVQHSVCCSAPTFSLFALMNVWRSWYSCLLLYLFFDSSSSFV